MPHGRLCKGNPLVAYSMAPITAMPCGVSAPKGGLQFCLTLPPHPPPPTVANAHEMVFENGTCDKVSVFVMYDSCRCSLPWQSISALKRCSEALKETAAYHWDRTTVRFFAALFSVCVCLNLLLFYCRLSFKVFAYKVHSLWLPSWISH